MEICSTLLQESKDCFIMVGLPARGKTYISFRLARYFNWVGYPAKVFNVGSYRRKKFSPDMCRHDFFDFNNIEAMEAREACAMEALGELIEWLNKKGKIAIYDATNTRLERRLKLKSILEKNHIRSFFIESICDDPETLIHTLNKVKIASPDYQNTNPEDALKDFLMRLKHYEDAYQPIDDSSQESLSSYIKIINSGEQYMVNLMNGYIQSRAVYFIMNQRLFPRNIYITRHGESVYNTCGRIGGDSDLSEKGLKFAVKLSKFFSEQRIKDLGIYTSCFKRSIQTASFICSPRHEVKALNEIDSGICDGMTYQEIKEKYPKEYEARHQDKYNYRYVMGESYKDVVNRLESYILELERESDVLIICHQAIARCLLGYYLNVNSNMTPFIDVPLHCIFKLTPEPYECKVEMIKINIDDPDKICDDIITDAKIEINTYY